MFGRIEGTRSLLLVEGKTESWLPPEFARQLKLGCDINGVFGVEYREFDLNPLTRLADDLGSRNLGRNRAPRASKPVAVELAVVPARG